MAKARPRRFCSCRCFPCCRPSRRPRRSCSPSSYSKDVVRSVSLDVTDEADQIVQEFRTRFHDTKRFHDRFAGAKFANYLFQAHELGGNGGRPAQARERVEEAQLFIEAAYACYEKMDTTTAGAPA